MALASDASQNQASTTTQSASTTASEKPTIDLQALKREALEKYEYIL